MNKQETQKLSNRLSRIIGQLNAIKSDIEGTQSKSCTTTLTEIKAADKALKTFAEAYVQVHLHECLQSNKSKQALEKELTSALHAAFNM